MPIWSLTAERLQKLKDAIARKKAEHDELLAKSEKDLWCADLDDFMVEWDNQLALDAEIQTNIRRMGRRTSKKIGAGGGARGRKAKDDDEYEPDKKGRGRPKAAAAATKPPVKVETKSAQRFAEMFSAKPKVKKESDADVEELSDNFSDDDYAALSRGKPAPKASKPVSEEVDNGRTKRAAASKARTLFDADSDSDDDDKMLGDVGALVKGIEKPDGESTSGRLSLYAMNRPDSSHGTGSSSALSKKTKSAKAFDLDSLDDTNYELLARASPLKTAGKGNDIDDFLSDDEPAPARAPEGLATVKKARGRPAGAKAKGKEETKPKVAPRVVPKTVAAKAAPKTATKVSTLSPAAKAYAAKKAVKKSALDEDEDSDEDMAEPDSPPPRPAARGRPGRAAAARRPIVIDDDDDSSMADPQEDGEEEEESDDPFDMDDDDED